MNKFSIIIVGILSIIIIVDGSSYLTNPTSRSNQRSSQVGCVGPACLGPCDSETPSPTPINAVRGQTLTINWPRNNRAGGFVRFAWAKQSESNDHYNFDINVQKMMCFEVGCGAADPSNPNGGDLGTPDGSVSPCGTTITVPVHLEDGLWTLQWAYFGGAFTSGDYFSCVDYNIVGGSAVGPKATANFVGGDYSNPGTNICKFFNTNELHVCANEPCLKGPLPGEHAGAPTKIERTPNPVPGAPIPCVINSDCPSNICQRGGFCVDAPKKEVLDAGAKAALVFAGLVLLTGLIIALFFIINKKEVPYMVPFKGRI